MKLVRCILLSVVVSIVANAQSKLDSLKNLLHESRIRHDEKEEVSNLFLIANLLFQLHEYDSSIHYFNVMLKKTSDKDSQASALNAIGVAYSVKGLPSKSIPYYNKSITLYEEIHDTSALITISNNLAIIYKDKGLYESALEISFNALPKLEGQTPGRPLASFYNTIGTVYVRIQDYEKAYEFYRKSLETRIAINYEQGVGQSYNNIGELFNEKKEFDSALVNLYKAVEIRKKTNDTRGLGRTLTNIGHALMYSNRNDEAITQLMEALKLTKTSNDLIAEILALHEIGTVFTKTKNFKQAEESLNKASQLIDSTDSRDYLRRNVELYADLYRSTGSTQKLINTLERLIVIKDSVLNEEKIESLLALEIQYETEKKEQEIILLQQQRKMNEAELEKNQLQKIVLAVIVLFLIVTAMLGYRLYFAKQREKNISDLHNKEINHRTKNNLQMLASFFTIQASVMEGDKKAQELIIDMQGRVKTMALVHSKLYKNIESSELDLQEYITDLLKSLIYTYGFYSDKLNLELNTEKLSVDVDRAIKIGLVVNELVTNALKYAYSGQENPLLKVSLSKGKDLITLEVRDNGKHPLTTDLFQNGGSFGLRMIKSFIRDLNGNIELRNISGTSFLITIPQI